jgi:hypothetical protein
MAMAQSRRLKKKYIILGMIVVLLVALRIALPSILLKKANSFLGSFSPNYAIHIVDLDLAIIRGAYHFDGVTGKIKSDDKEFLSISDIDVSIAWRELFKGRVVTDIVVENPKFLLIKDIKKLEAPKKEGKDLKKNIFPLKIERLDIVEGKVTFEGIQSLSDKSHMEIDHINGRLTNITPSKNNPLSYFNLTTNIVDQENKFKFTGELDQTKKPMSIDLDAQVRNFQITKLNPYLKNHMPLTFTKGTVDVYAEVFSQDGKMKGYIKPFFRELDVVANKEHFKNVKHFGVEALTALSNLILRESKTKSVATIIDFTHDKKFDFKIGKAISKAIEHGFDQQLAPGIEDRYHLN